MKQAIFFILLTYFLSLNTHTAYAQKSMWKVQNIHKDYLMLDLTIKGDKFIATSRKHALKPILGSRKYFLGRLMGKVKKEIVNIKGHVTKVGAQLKLTGTYTTVWSEKGFEAIIKEDSLIGYTVYTAEDSTIHHYKLAGVKTQNPKARDYEDIIYSAIATTEAKLFDLSILEGKAWKKFKRKMLRVAPKIRDDYEFTRIYNADVSKLPFSHYGLSIKKENKTSSQTPKKYIDYERLDSNIGLLTAKSFLGNKIEVDTHIQKIRAHQPDYLIIDLRGNTGGSVEAVMPIARFLVQDTLYGGVFLTQKWFNKHAAPPRLEVYNRFPHFSKASYNLILKGIHEKVGLCLRVDPDSAPYNGQVYILMDKYTGSTAEPFVYGTKELDNITLVGEQTAGKMLNGESFDLGQNCELFLPTATYYATDGFKIDGVGVAPEIATESSKALETALEQIKTLSLKEDQRCLDAKTARN